MVRARVHPAKELKFVCAGRLRFSTPLYNNSAWFTLRAALQSYAAALKAKIRRMSHHIAYAVLSLVWMCLASNVLVLQAGALCTIRHFEGSASADRVIDVRCLLTGAHWHEWYWERSIHEKLS